MTHDKWETHSKSDESFELFEHVSLMTLDSIMKCAFRSNTNCQTVGGGESGTNSYIKAVYELSDLVNVRFRNFPYHSEWIFQLSPHGYKYRKACNVAHSHTGAFSGLSPENMYMYEFDKEIYPEKDEDQPGLSDEAIRAEVDTFMFEGHDTTASGISWTLYSLACNPEHQQICRDEAISTLEGRDTMECKIPYTTMCIKESLRLYPPVPGMSRKITKPMTFFDGRTVPEGKCEERKRY
uniref:Cytochrome P450, family 4, subfamily T, polypeptide 8 n=1 Tax=Hucho hucho TaxID=62062 RepID=A0A4W5PQU7_9TELE